MRTALLMVFLLPAAVHAQQTVRDSTISVAVTRSTRVAPDRASIYILVEGSAETPPDAVARVERKLRAVTEALKAQASRVEVDRSMVYGVGPGGGPNVYPPPPGPPSSVARAVIRVQTNHADQIAHITAAALTAGASGVGSIMFEASTADSIRRARTAEALAAAKADAQAIASSLDGKLGALVDVSTNAPNVGFAGPNVINFDTRFMQPTQVPEVTNTSSVMVRYRLVR